MITRLQAQRSGLIELTYPSRPDEKLDTMYGKVSYLEWCSLERDRMYRLHTRERGYNTSRLFGVVEHNGLVSLWASPVRPVLEMVN